MTSSSYSNGFTESRTYQTDNTLATITYTGTAIGNLAYTWDQTDNNLDQSWNLSPVGDWTSTTQNSSVQNRTHGPVHELLSAAGQSLTYDAKGNMTLIPMSLRPGTSPLSMSWDFNNKLRAADTNANGIDDVFYLWDALGRRVGRTAASTTKIYFQDGQQTLADYASGAAATSPTYQYLWASYINEIVLRTSGTGNLYFHRKQKYSITAITDGSGTISERYAYSAYGTPTITDASGTARTMTAIGNRYLYTGREWDETLALYHYRARMYDSLAGRFCSRDPIGFAISANVYDAGFLSNEVDPSGESPNCPMSPGQPCLDIGGSGLPCSPGQRRSVLRQCQRDCAASGMSYQGGGLLCCHRHPTGPMGPWGKRFSCDCKTSKGCDKL